MLAKSEVSAHLTRPDKDLADKANATDPGMAHFAGTGPAGKTCRECLQWTGCGASGYYSKTGGKGGAIKPRACAKFRDLMRGQVGPAVGHWLRACKYFELNETPPPVTQAGWWG